MAKDIDVLIRTEDKPEIEKITKLIKTMNDNEKTNMLIFLQGVKFNETLHNQQISE